MERENANMWDMIKYDTISELFSRLIGKDINVILSDENHIKGILVDWFGQCLVLELKFDKSLYYIQFDNVLYIQDIYNINKRNRKKVNL